MIQKILSFILLTQIIAWAPTARASDDGEVPAWILGNWKFIGYIYHNEFKPPLNPNLEIIFKYQADGTDFLYWSRKGEPGFCERRGHFSVTNNIYNDEVEWTNPGNARDCGQDPDMQVGKKTSTEITFAEGRLLLNLGLGGEPFYYLFESISSYPKPE